MFLRSRINAVVRPRGEYEIEVSLLGSYSNLAMAEKIGQTVREWEAGERLSAYEAALDA